MRIASGGESAMAETAPTVFVVPRVPRYFSLFGTAALGIVTAIMIGFTILLLPASWPLSVFVLAPISIFLGALTGYVARDLRGKWNLRVELDRDAVKLDLPGGRSLIHRPVAQHVTIPNSDIAGLETRLEAYGNLGTAMIQRSYVLRRKTGELIFLFEDRALGSGMESPMFDKLAA